MISWHVNGATDRPRVSLLALLAISVIWVALGTLYTLGCLPTGQQLLFGGVTVALVAALAFVARQPITSEDVWGVLTPLVVATAAAATTASLIQPSSNKLWAQFLLCCILTATALVLMAREWSHRWFLGTGLLLLAVLVALLVRVGYQSEIRELISTPITASFAEVAGLKAEAATGAEEAAAGLRKASDEAIKSLADALPSASEEFRTAGEPILSALLSGKTADLEGDLAQLVALPVSVDKATQDLRVRTSAIAAVEAYRENGQGAPPSTAIDDALNAACLSAEREGVVVADCARATETTEVLDPAVALHSLAVELAYFRSVVSPDDQSLKDAASAAAATEPKDLQVALLDALVSGPEVVIASIDPDRSRRLVPGTLGWLLLGVLALWAMRQLLKLNALQMPGPVNVAYEGDHKAELRLAVLQNLKTPAASPGAAVVNSITDLSSLAGPKEEGIAAVVAAVSSVFTVYRGYVVHAELSPKNEAAATAKDGSPPSATVLVSVQAASSEESLGSASFTDESPEKAMRAAGLWAAGFLLERSTRIPKWASWTAETAKSLDATTSPSPTLGQLEVAAKGAPTSGWILQLYGHELELAGREREAIVVYARAVVTHPRYLVARYRFAAALGMLGRDVSKWTTATYAEQAATWGAVSAACARLDVDPPSRYPGDGQSVVPTESDFRNLAAGLLKSIEEDSRFWNNGAALLRRSDRDQSWLAWRGRHSSRRSTFWLAKSGRLVYLDKGDHRTALLRDVEHEADKPASSWQLSYNLACAYAQDPRGLNLDAALGWLETCLMRPGVHALNAQWARSDPDLEPISTHPRFVRFCAQVEKGGK